jgi:hypothetical protein
MVVFLHLFVFVHTNISYLFHIILVFTLVFNFEIFTREPAQLSFAPKISGEFLSIWAKFPQISKFFGWTMDEIRPNRKKFARNFWGRTSTARIRPVRPEKYLLCSGWLRNMQKGKTISWET